MVLLVFWPSRPKRPTKPINIYPVELISAAQLVETHAPKITETKTTPPPPKPKEQTVPIAKTAPKKQMEKKSEPPPPPTAQQSEAPVAAGSSGLKIDTKDFPFSYYLAILQNRIQRNWQPPYQQTTLPEKLTTMIRFQVQRSGKIVNVVVEKSSGRYLFDQAAQRAIYSADPLPPLPDDFAGEFLSVHIEFEGL
ncbi:MAG: TonB C-terminal domain-containing protein [candidate division KSB1 bacterium]|nr:TonB C-terminal domain-containing protein [candidate division KSB1 bacterium]MDZ7334984.1 TonB C-terminal domain-containing protein [candidate division KSB1 bacterium]MDZ7357139.1 TonB C-terminal domain-containing protein [candidate division KSB1 bacterium]MDZ7400207.1 TonB C-terminal domain-containing protein [candidate division KSB1 bacterium]